MSQNDKRQTEVAVLAGGCFWGVEEILRAVPGVVDTDVGYTGGTLENPTSNRPALHRLVACLHAVRRSPYTRRPQ